MSERRPTVAIPYDIDQNCRAPRFLGDAEASAPGRKQLLAEPLSLQFGTDRKTAEPVGADLVPAKTAAPNDVRRARILN